MIYLLFSNIILIIIFIVYYGFRVSWILDKGTIKDYWRQIQKWQERNNLETNILMMLREREKLSPFDILAQVNIYRLTHCGKFIPVSIASVYVALNRLEKKGLIQWEWGKEEENKGRKQYSLINDNYSQLGENNTKA